jgi:hypothetical protein
MNIMVLLENTTNLSLAESWEYTCSIVNDMPLSAAYWNLEEMSGEKLLDELPFLQVNPAQLIVGTN